MATTIKLMTDYDSFPLWWANSEQVGDIDPATLPLAEETVARLLRWAGTYDAQLNWADPAQSTFFNDQEREDFEREGVLLWEQLRHELAPDFEVWYFSERTSTLYSYPGEVALDMTVTPVPMLTALIRS